MSRDDVHKREVRFPGRIQTECVYSGESHLGSAHNLSRTGVLIEGDMPSPPPGPVDITLKAPSGKLTVFVTGRVARYSPPDGDAEAVLAIEFGALSEDQRRGIESLLARLKEAHPPGPFDALRPDASPIDIRKALDAVPLPQRVSLAARALAREREILRHDHHSAVLEALAHNPGLTSAEARALAESENALASTVEAIAGDPRWSKDEDVRLTVAASPRVPLHVGERIISELKPPALRRLMSRPGLQGPLRQKVLRILARG